MIYRAKITWFITLLTASNLIFAQNTFKLQSLEPIQPTYWAGTDYKENLDKQFRIRPHDRLTDCIKNNLFSNSGSQAHQNVCSEKVEGGILPVLGANFQGNQLTGGTPPDNSIAISNDGIIASIDNFSLEFYSDQGDSLGRVLIDTLFSDTTLSHWVFDPWIEYDFDKDRFYLTLVHDTISPQSRILLGVSKTNDPRDGWHQYAIPTSDSILMNAWIDRANLGYNNDYLFISGFILDDSTDALIGNKVYRVDKSSLLNGGAMTYKTFLNTKNPNGNNAFNMVAASLGQVGNYGPDFYWVSTERLGGDQIFLHHYTETIGATGDSIVTTAITTSPYSVPADAKQLGSNDLLGTNDCRVQTAMYLNGKVHYAFQFDIGSDFSGISYNRITLNDTSHTRSTWGLPDTFAYAYPAIASYGVDSLDESVMIGFVRSGETIYPQVCVVNFDACWGPGSRIVKNGQGFVDLSPGTIQRWGDYTGICNRFNSLSPGIWMAGHYGFGTVPNEFGVENGWNTWIAEIGDGQTVASTPISQNEKPQLLFFPNPTSTTIKALFTSSNTKQTTIEISNVSGVVVKKVSAYPNNTVEIDVSNLPSGMYFAHITGTNQNYANFVVYH